MTVFGFIWWFQVSESGDEELYGQTIADSIYMALQLIATGGFEDSIGATRSASVGSSS